jgi:hypothetical protein
MENAKNEKTLEEAAKDYVKSIFDNGIPLAMQSIFIKGAEYQAEQMYSEDEVRLLLQTQKSNCYVAILMKTKDEELASIAGDAPEPGGFNGWVK